MEFATAARSPPAIHLTRLRPFPVRPALVLAPLAALLVLPACQKASRSDPPTSPPPAAEPNVSRITMIKNGGGRLHWSRANVIAFDQLGADQYFDVFTMNPDGSNEICLTCGRSELPNRHMGNPAWYPSGEFIVFQAQKASAPSNPISDFFANPGSGINNDLWVMNREGTRFWRLTDVPLQHGGVLHPHFSPTGDRLLWSERLSAAGGPIGEWALKMADFRTSDGVPRIENVRQYQPGRQRRFYESHGFTPDGTKILFSGNLESGQAEGGGDIYVFDAATGDLQNLTNSPSQWDEHAQIMPSGDWIVWMSSMGVGGDPARPKSDYWIMRTDGTGKRQITFFNAQGERDFVPGGVTAADSSWSPDGSRLMGYLILHETLTAARMLIIDFSLADTAEDTPEFGEARASRHALRASSATAIVDTTRTITIAATEDDPEALAGWNREMERLVRLRQLDLAVSRPDAALPGRTLDRFVQHYEGIPVLGGEIVRQRAGAAPQSIFGTIYTIDDVDVDAMLTGVQAAQALQRLLDEPLLAAPEVPRLVIVPRENGRHALAYEIRAVAAQDVIVALVDAHSGALVARDRGAHPRHTAVRRGSGVDVARNPLTAVPLDGPGTTPIYDMRGDSRRTIAVLTDSRSRDWIGSFEASESDGSAVATRRSIQAALDYLAQRLVAHPLSGRALVALVHPADRSTDGDMPLLDGGVLYAGRGVLIVPDNRNGAGEAARSEQIRHQVGHALVDMTSRLPYDGEAGALNEAVARLVERAESGTGAGAVDATMRHDSEAGAELVLNVLEEALGTDADGAPSERAHLEAAFLRAFTQLLPAHATLRMARASSLQAVRDIAGTAGSGLSARLAEAWDRAGVRLW